MKDKERKLKKAVVYVHGKHGSVEEAKRYRQFFDDTYEDIGFNYQSEVPWDAQEEFGNFFDAVGKEYQSILLIATSIGAYFSLVSLSQKPIEKALFISPIVDMEQLILDMMKWTNITENELQEKKEVSTSFGQTLSWKYLSYARNHPITWHVPTCILYGGKDSMTSLETITNFAEATGAKLTVMAGGEHWFHTKEQMDFLDNWVKENIVIT